MIKLIKKNSNAYCTTTSKKFALEWINQYHKTIFSSGISTSKYHGYDNTDEGLDNTNTFIFFPERVKKKVYTSSSFLIKKQEKKNKKRGD